MKNLHIASAFLFATAAIAGQPTAAPEAKPVAEAPKMEANKMAADAAKPAEMKMEEKKADVKVEAGKAADAAKPAEAMKAESKPHAAKHPMVGHGKGKRSVHTTKHADMMNGDLKPWTMPTAEDMKKNEEACEAHCKTRKHHQGKKAKKAHSAAQANVKADDKTKAVKNEEGEEEGDNA